MTVTAAIIQARLGSTRLPGKVLEPLAGKPVLAHVVDRCRAIPGVDVVCCAVPETPSDDPVAKAALRFGAEVVRGSEVDVLDRYATAARVLGADVVLRVTSDCPLISPGLCGAVLALRAVKRADFACNNMPRGWPHGLDCEAFTRAVLERDARTATDPLAREHVSIAMRRDASLERWNLAPDSAAAYEDWRLTIDYPEDLRFVRALMERLDDPETAGLEDVARTLAEHPELRDINASAPPHPRKWDGLPTVALSELRVLNPDVAAYPL